jgi:predicted N-formylglutamate amidohydrolase
VIPGNLHLNQRERERRIALAYKPFHGAIQQLLDKRESAGLESCLISIHSFTPRYKDVERPWDIGIVHDEDERLSRPMIGALQRLPRIRVGVNEPYSPADRVYHTVAKHAHPRDLPCAMVEIRNDRIADTASQLRWAGLLAGILSQLQPSESDPAGRVRHSSVH